MLHSCKLLPVDVMGLKWVMCDNDNNGAHTVTTGHIGIVA